MALYNVPISSSSLAFCPAVSFSDRAWTWFIIACWRSWSDRPHLPPGRGQFPLSRDTFVQFPKLFSVDVLWPGAAEPIALINLELLTDSRPFRATYCLSSLGDLSSRHCRAGRAVRSAPGVHPPPWPFPGATALQGRQLAHGIDLEFQSGILPLPFFHSLCNFLTGRSLDGLLDLCIERSRPLSSGLRS